MSALVSEKCGLELCGNPIVKPTHLISQPKQDRFSQFNGDSIVMLSTARSDGRTDWQHRIPGGALLVTIGKGHSLFYRRRSENRYRVLRVDWELKDEQDCEHCDEQTRIRHKPSSH